MRILQNRGIEIIELLLIGTFDPVAGLTGETSATSLAEVAGLLAAAWGAPGQPVTADELAGQDPGTQLDTVTARLEPHAPMDTPALRRWLRNTAEWRRALARSAAAHTPRPLSGPATVNIVLAVRGAVREPGGFDRWIASPPLVHELDREPWALTCEESAADLALLTSAPPVPRDADSPSPVIPINRHRNGRRSIWAHNLYGEVSYAIYLSRHLGLRKPVIGLEQIGAASPDVPPRLYDSVEDMAGHYTAELRTHFADEPFLLGGCSFGGVLAYEMARQLQEAGEEVSHLIAIDPIMPGTEAWDSVDWGTVTALEAEAFSLVMLGNAMYLRWGVARQIDLAMLTGLDLEAQLDVVARHIHRLSPACPAPEMIRRQILVRHRVMLHNGDLLQTYRPRPLKRPIPTTLFHATQGFLAPDNTNGLPAVPRTSGDRTNGFAGYVGDRTVIHDMAADHHTIAHDDNLARIAGMLAPLLGRDGFPAGLFPASLNPAGPKGAQ
ncbi:thioesterase domain-containing protein [Streptomyces sp. NBC_00690]|uniref:thioesterase domain-containing protein n=1 Tax=Streptomyces sp. NBC_00690 TaxID=2975808 RepID=UPI002E2D3AA4|nr:thioesterase domain-containing protein [Streptomyces sp. NBC_00690]